MRAIAALAVCGLLIAGCSSAAPSTVRATAVPTSRVPTSPSPSTPAPATTSATSTPSERPTPTPLGPPEQDIEAAGATRLLQGGDWLQLAGGSAWTAVDDGVQQLDGKTGAPKRLVPASGICTGMDVGFGRLWLADCDAGTVSAIDPATAAIVATYPLKGKFAVEEGSVGAGE